MEGGVIMSENAVQGSHKDCCKPDCKDKKKLPFDRAFCVKFDLCIEAKVTNFRIIDLGPCPDFRN